MRFIRNQLSRFLPLGIFALGLVCASNLRAATPYVMSTGNYLETFSDIANWANNFSAGIGAEHWSSVAVNTAGVVPDAQKTTVSTATFSTGTSSGVQRGTGNIVQLSSGTGDNTNANAIDLYLDFTGTNAGALSF